MKKKTPHNLLFAIISIWCCINLIGCGKKESDSCQTEEKISYDIDSTLKNILIYKGTEILAFIDTKHSRDTIKFKGTGIVKGIDTSFIFIRNRHLISPCRDTGLFDYYKIVFINIDDPNDYITAKVVSRIPTGVTTPRPYLSIEKTPINWAYSESVYSLGAVGQDSVILNDHTFYNVYKLYDNPDIRETFIYWNYTLGIITYKDAYRDLYLTQIIR